MITGCVLTKYCGKKGVMVLKDGTDAELHCDQNPTAKDPKGRAIPANQKDCKDEKCADGELCADFAG